MPSGSQMSVGGILLTPADQVSSVASNTTIALSLTRAEKVNEGGALTPDIMARAVTKRDWWNELKKSTEEAMHAYFGGASLYPHIAPFSRKEEPEKLNWRRERTVDHYENYPAEIAGTYTEGIYRAGDVSREVAGASAGAKQLSTYFQTEYDVWFQSEAAPYFLLLPECFVYVNPPTVATPLATMAQQTEARAWPRPELVMPQYVWNLSLAEDGALNWISRGILEDDGTVSVEVLDRKCRYRISQDGRTIMSAEPHGFTRVPVVWRPWKMNQAYGGRIGYAFMQPIVKKSLACLQVTSMLVEAGYFHLNLQMVMDPDTFDKALETGVGNASILIYAGGKEGKEPFYMQKPSMELEMLRRWAFEDIPRSIYRSARVRDRSSDKALSTSGISKLMDTVPELSILKVIANYLQSIDQDVCDFIARAYLGDQNAETSVQYPARFDLKSSAEMLKEVSDLAAAEKNGFTISSPTATGEIYMQVVSALLPDVDDGTYARIEAEVKNAVDALIAAREKATEEWSAAPKQFDNSASQPSRESEMNDQAAELK